jgi:diguanylate cyclase (GGDEF)-like protein
MNIARTTIAGSVRPVRMGRGKPAAGSAGNGAPAVGDVSSVLGLSEAELTPNVRAAISTLLDEVDTLRREVEAMRGRAVQLERLADEDSLLPVANRRAFVRELSRMMGWAERYGSPGCLLYFDVDNLKLVNDSHGHAAGDACLKRIGETMMSNVRGSDIVGRLGGDEFGIIMTHCDPQTAADKAQCLLALIEAEPLVWHGASIPISLSVGLCPFSGSEQPIDMLHAADRAMYRQKGRALHG